MRIGSAALRVIWVLGLAAFFAVASSAAEKSPPQSEIGEGTLMLAGDNPVPIPLKQTDVKIKVTGFVASVDVNQTFTNSNKEAIEAVYIFPLPSESAVDDMMIKIGDRTIKGVVKERTEARRNYEQARDAGKQAALLEQERPNIFTTSVANIQPGFDIAVHIHYTQRLDYDDGGFRLAFPMVVAPRYIPGSPISKTGDGVMADTDRVPDASRITSAMLPPDLRPATNITLSVELNSGFPVKDLKSDSHEIAVVKDSPSLYKIELAKKDEIPNRDFVLEYKIAGEHPEAVVLQALNTKRQGFFLLMTAPPSDFNISDLRSKEVIMIADVSGSMSGEKLEQAKRALLICMKTLNPQDAFNIIRFSSDFQPMWDKSLPFNEQNRAAAEKYVNGLFASGGTEMLQPLVYSLQQPKTRDYRVVVFFTDGQVGNEEEIFKQVIANLGETRIFTFGIDTAVNEYFLKKLAHLGRGTAEFILPKQQNIEPIIARFQKRISAPMLTDLEIDWSGLEVQNVYPKPIPDLYANQPVFLVGKFNKNASGSRRDVTLNAKNAIGKTRLPITFDTTSSNADRKTLAALWARTRVDFLSDRLLEKLDPKAAADIRKEIVALGIKYKLMTQYTSFVAIDEQTVISQKKGSPMRVSVPVALPQGWNPNNVPGVMTNVSSSASYQIVTNSGTNTIHSAPLSTAASGASNSASSSSPQAWLKSESGGVSYSVVPEERSAFKTLGNGTSKALSGPSKAILPNPAKPDQAPGLSNKEDLARYLAQRQNANGSWGDANSSDSDRMRSTIIAALAFIGSGTNRGIYSAQVTRALSYVISDMDDDGMLSCFRGKAGQTKMQAFALWAVAEQRGSGVWPLHEKEVASLLLNGLLRLRSDTGRWLSREGGKESSIATMWALTALQSGRNVDLEVDENMLKSSAEALAVNGNYDMKNLLAEKIARLEITLEETETVKRQLRSIVLKLSFEKQFDKTLFALLASKSLDIGVLRKLEERIESQNLGHAQSIESIAQRYLALTITALH